MMIKSTDSSEKKNINIKKVNAFNKNFSTDDGVIFSETFTSYK